MKKIYVLAIGLIATLQISAQNCNGRYQADIYPTINVTTVQYGSAVDLNSNTVNLMMDIYEPIGDTSTYRPLILLAHGGSFSAGTKNDADQVYFATELAKKGYVCASINYRLAPSAFSLIAEETTVKVVFMAIQDGKAAVRFFKKDAATTDTYKINPDQVFFGGTSAGGILAINLTYVDSASDLSSFPNWETWLNEVGGLEGSSGNPGYCSRTNGTFGFAGGVADTNFIDADDVPWYGSHATGDQTVQYGYGQPLNGFTPVFLYGSGNITDRMNNLNTYNHLDTYSGGNHPPFSGSPSIMENNKDSLAMFLYNILDCNPSNLQKSTQKNCINSPQPIGIDDISTAFLQASVYPNPFNNELNVELTSNINNTTIKVIDAVGKVVAEQQAKSYINKLNLDYLPVGMYFVIVSSNEGTYVQKVIRK
jgi:para-nitrobenzyl esterase